ncbi:MAG: hypothetical protein L0271_10605 [Gemmatimonadetes bacterium]|nr:hypothetical protein [Gemmatimonadota bacterium]
MQPKGHHPDSPAQQPAAQFVTEIMDREREDRPIGRRARGRPAKVCGRFGGTSFGSRNLLTLVIE